MKMILIATCILIISCRQEDDTAGRKEMLRHAASIRIKKVLEQVKADCDANLQAETYKKVKQLQKSKRQPAAR